MQTNTHLQEASTHRLQAGLRRAVLMRIALPALLVLTLVGSLIGCLYILSWRAIDDPENAPDHRGVGVVTAIVPFYTRMGMTSNVSFLIDGHRASLRNPNDANTALLHVADRVPVTYRIGKSGTYYVFGFEPLPRKEQVPLLR